jgi:hypothetical protein
MALTFMALTFITKVPRSHRAAELAAEPVSER